MYRANRQIPGCPTAQRSVVMLTMCFLNLNVAPCTYYYISYITYLLRWLQGERPHSWRWQCFEVAWQQRCVASAAGHSQLVNNNWADSTVPCVDCWGWSLEVRRGRKLRIDWLMTDWLRRRWWSWWLTRWWKWFSQKAVDDLIEVGIRRRLPASVLFVKWGEVLWWFINNSNNGNNNNKWAHSGRINNSNNNINNSKSLQERALVVIDSITCSGNRAVAVEWPKFALRYEWLTDWLTIMMKKHLLQSPQI